MEEKVEIMEQSILKNIQELSEFLIYDLHIDNYYDLIEELVDLYNFRVKVYRKNKKLFEEISKELESTE